METIIKHFLEDNWTEYLAHCEQHGIDSEEEVEAETDRVLSDQG